MMMMMMMMRMMMVVVVVVVVFRLIKPEDSFNPLCMAILYSVSWVSLEMDRHNYV